MPKVLFHAGAHKTGSSYLQSNFNVNREALAAQNCDFVYLKYDEPALFKALLPMRRDNASSGGKLLDKFLQKISSSQNNALISNEAFLGTMAFSKALYPHNRDMMRRLARGLKNCDVTMAFCVRDLGGWLESSYSQRVLNGETRSFEELLAKAPLAKLRWEPIVANMIDTFGEANVKVWTFEDFKKNDEGCFRAVAGLAGVAPESLRLETVKPVNVAFPQHTIDIAIGWNRVLQKCKFPKQKQQNLRKRLRRILRETDGAKITKKLLDPETRARLTKDYEADVAAMRTRWPNNFISFDKPAAPVAQPAASPEAALAN